MVYFVCTVLVSMCSNLIQGFYFYQIGRNFTLEVTDFQCVNFFIGCTELASVDARATRYSSGDCRFFVFMNGWYGISQIIHTRTGAPSE